MNEIPNLMNTASPWAARGLAGFHAFNPPPVTGTPNDMINERLVGL